MHRTLTAGAATGALTLSLALAGPAAAQFLPDQATYVGKTNHGGDIDFRVHDHRIVRVKGHLPLPKNQSCEYSSSRPRRVPLNIPENDEVSSGPFKIRATQRVNPHTSRWRRLRLLIKGQFSSDASRATGRLHAKVYDAQGTCETRDDLTWHVSDAR